MSEKRSDVGRFAILLLFIINVQPKLVGTIAGPALAQNLSFNINPTDQLNDQRLI
jgi:hypothetical protein